MRTPFACGDRRPRIKSGAGCGSPASGAGSRCPLGPPRRGATGSYAQTSASGRYTARSGETLATVAASLYGDANLWYKLAEANGLGGNAALSEGQQLTLPTGVSRNTHNASTFKPYDPAEIIGDTMPTTPKPPKGARCGVFGQILIAAVAIGLSVWLGPQFIGVAAKGERRGPRATCGWVWAAPISRPCTPMTIDTGYLIF